MFYDVAVEYIILVEYDNVTVNYVSLDHEFLYIETYLLKFLAVVGDEEDNVFLITIKILFP